MELLSPGGENEGALDLGDSENWYSPDMATFGDRVAGAREALGMDQAQLARRLGVKPKTLASWENDISEPRANKLQMLAGILGVSLMWLLNEEGEDTPTQNTDDQRHVDDLLLKLRALNRELTGRKSKILASMLHDVLDSEVLQHAEHEPSTPRLFHAGVFLQSENREELRKLERAALQFASYIGYSREEENLEAQAGNAR